MEEVKTDDAPAPIGPFSQGIIDGDVLHVSGQGPADPETREVLVDGVQEQTEQVLENIAAVLEAGGASMDDVVKTTVYMADMDNYGEVNEVYGEYMSEPYPARAAVEAARLPLDNIHVEIRATASLKE
ncbi:Rid family detoxifying hydrolase [Halobellus marinus]|jgi:2-iminobutanoate/2-iminopropanoate deaminase|uniref:Rid family detoxifying hydrolase n=1 Tax=Halobellus TaxID=1073986 RepID=UPI0028AAE620|nr:Rid family detoxifying hydrolase [Halobellus sp. DFY28]